MIVTGEAKSGKSAFMYHLAELWHLANPKKKIYAVNFPQDYRFLLPKYIEPISKYMIDKVKDCMILIEESAIATPARDWHRTFNKLLAQLLAIHGHKKQRIIAVTQHLSLIDKSIIVMSKYLAVKPYSYFSYRMEREELREIISKAWLIYSKLTEEFADFIDNANLDEYDLHSLLKKLDMLKKTHIIIFGFDRPIVYAYDLPSFWNEQLSHVWHAWTFKKEIADRKEMGTSITEIIEDLLVQRKIKHWKDLLKYDELKGVKPQVLKALFYRVKKRLRS